MEVQAGNICKNLILLRAAIGSELMRTIIAPSEENGNGYGQLRHGQSSSVSGAGGTAESRLERYVLQGLTGPLEVQ